MDLSVVEGDITEQRVDAIVNAANRAMRGGGGVDGAIHRTAGPGLLAECAERFPAGWPRAGQGGQPGTASGPVGDPRRGPEPSAAAEPRLLESCYTNALGVADELGASSVAFPLVSAGVYGWPLEDAVACAVETITATPTLVESVVLVAFGRSTYDAVLTAVTEDRSS